MMAVTRTTTAAARPKAVRAANYQSYFIPTDMPAVCQLWLYRLLLTRSDLSRFLQKDDFLFDAMLAKFGLSERILVLKKPGEVTDILQRKCRELASDPAVHIPHDLAAKIAELGGVIGLNDIEQQVLALAVLVNTDEGLKQYSRSIELKQLSCLEKTLQVMLDCPLEAIRSALHAKSALVSCGLLSLQFPNELEDVFDFISVNFPLKLAQMGSEPLSLFKHLWQQSPASSLSFADYPHIEQDLRVLRPYLQRAMAMQKVGVNVLIYGAPGHGKTELARLLADDASTKLYEVSSEDDDGDPLGGQQRLRAYRFAQRCLASGKPQMILFDEAEDVFSQNPFSRHFTEHKCWLNRLLEQNPMPCIWLTNDIHDIDAAVVRRFDMVIEVPNLPKAQRALLLQQLTDGLVDATQATELVAHPALSAAVIKRATDVMKTLHPVFTPQDAENEPPVAGPTPTQALQRLVNNTLKAQGHSVAVPELNMTLEIYDPAFINSDVAIDNLVTGVQHAGNARICLYGPSGTGKTAFCQYVAEQLGKPLLFKPASSLLSCYVGESEKRIAQAFAEATEEGAVLLLDEVDSFLQPRTKAEHSWQVTQVNELLQQMERFNGVLLATTNQLPQLDQAALRRFDVLIGFGYLTAAQAIDLLHVYCKTLQLPVHEPVLKQLQQLMLLTPLLTVGDFHAVARQARFRPLASADAFVAALQAMLRFKTGATVISENPTTVLQ